jgi:hypothetical protein
MSAGRHLATWILTHCAPDYRGDSFVGDLIEQYEQRGPWWYWRQALGALRVHAIRRLSSARETDVPAAEYVGDLMMAIALGVFALNQLPFYAEMLIGTTRLARSPSTMVVVSAVIGAALLGAVAIAHAIRIRTPTTA